MSASSQLRSNAIAVASSYLWVREVGGDNKGQAVEQFLSVVGLGPGYPWCAAFVAHVGKSVMAEGWPLPLTGGCQALYEAAEKKGMVTDSPQPGDIFLLWFPSLKRFGHTGFIINQAANGKWNVVEGNAADPSKPSSRNGWGVFKRQRVFSDKDRFIVW